MKTCVIDFETVDKFVRELNLGPGWVYAYHYNSPNFKILGCGFKDIESEESIYITDMKELIVKLKQYDALVMHNAAYDFGILKYLEKIYPEFGTWTNKFTIYDTLLLYKIYDSSLPSYSLDSLAKEYLNIRKTQIELAKEVWKLDLYPWKKKELEAKLKANKDNQCYNRSFPIKRIEIDKVIRFAYQNLDQLQEKSNIVKEYCIQDIKITDELFKKVLPAISEELLKDFSDLVHVIIEYRIHGVRIDLNKARELSVQYQNELDELQKELDEIIGYPLNVTSTKDVPKALKKLGINLPKLHSGKESVTKSWLEKQTLRPCVLIKEIRKLRKLKDSFIDKLLEMQEYTCPGAADIGRVFPSLNILEAKTGRFSCTGPNIQQQSKKGGIRDLFLADEGEKFYSLDFSAQENRIQLHFACKLGLESVNVLIQEYRKNPKYDMHTMVASLLFGVPISEVTKEQRTIAKTINLGVSYGMGLEKMARSLKVTEEEAGELRRKYFEYLPFLKELNDYAMKTMKQRGNIRTLMGRYLKKDKPQFFEGKIQTFEYRALNKLIQGTAAEQTIKAMIWAWKEGIKVLFPVHDELCMSGTLEQAERLKYIMENAIQLELPCYTEIKEGTNWGNVKEISKKDVEVAA